MDEKELGRRIQQERKRRGLTQEKVEQRLGLPKKAITRIESGVRLPSTLELAKLAELFHLSIETFFKDEAVEEDPLIALHRVAPGLDQDPQVREEVDRCVHLCKEGASLEKLLDHRPRQCISFYPFNKPSTPLEAIKQGEQAAKEERRRLGIGSVPIGDIVELISSQGIWCAAIRLPPTMSGLFLRHSSMGGMVILVNAIHACARKRFSYAHEYGHALFDADHPLLISDTENSSELLETRANAFAAAFLMPSEGIAEILDFLNKGLASRASFAIFDASAQGVVEAKERQIAKNQKLSPQNIAFIARRFGVSYQAMVYRLHTLRYLSQQEREALLKEEVRGNDYLRLLDLEKLEPLGGKTPLQRELRNYISLLVIEAYRQEKISRGRVVELSKLLELSAQDLLDLVDIDNE